MEGKQVTGERGEKLVDALVVEDSLDDAELTSYALKQGNENIHFHTVRDGAEALEYIFSTKKYAGHQVPKNLKLILLDIKLPKVSGLEVLKRIKEDEITRLLPVVVLTSSREQRDLSKAYQLGANSYIVKPTLYDHYVKTVSTLAHYWCVINQRPL